MAVGSAVKTGEVNMVEVDIIEELEVIIRFCSFHSFRRVEELDETIAQQIAFCITVLVTFSE